MSHIFDKESKIFLFQHKFQFLNKLYTSFDQFVFVGCYFFWRIHSLISNYQKRYSVAQLHKATFFTTFKECHC